MSRRLSKVFGSKSKDFPDLSVGFDSRFLQLDELSSFGIHDPIVASSYDQVQSLLAIATLSGVYVLGQAGVEGFFAVPDHRTTAFLVLHGSHLIVIDTKSTLYQWTLEGQVKDPVARQTLRGIVTAIHTEPTLDWLFLGLRDGSVDVWDIEGEQMNRNFKIKDQYRDRQEEWRLMDEWFATKHLSPVLGLSIHPLDLGMLLMVYDVGVVLYSLKDNQAKQFYEVTIPGSDHKAASRPTPTCATFSPDGAFVLVGYRDGTLAFFDVQDGEVPLQVRTLAESDINYPRRQTGPIEEIVYAPIVGLCWCARIDTADTYLLVAGGFSRGLDGVSLMDFGKPPVKPNYSEFFAFPQRQRIMPVQIPGEVINILPFGTASPFHNYHDPRCLLVTSGSGNVEVLCLPEGEPAPGSLLPVALSMSSPPIIICVIADFPRFMVAELQHLARQRASIGKSLLIGGALKKTPPVRQPQCLCTVHGEHLVRIYDIQHGKALETALLELDTSELLNSSPISSLTTSGAAGEIAVASEDGIVVVYHFNAGVDEDQLVDGMIDLSLLAAMPTPIPEAQKMLFAPSKTIRSKPGLQPVCILDASQGRCTSLDLSDVGFLVAGFESGSVIVIDLRGPAVIFAADCKSLYAEKSKSKKKVDRSTSTAHEVVTTASVLALNLDDRHSLAILLGSSLGRVMCLEVLKEASGAYSIVLHSSFSIGNQTPITRVLGVNNEGRSLMATPEDLLLMSEDGQGQDCIIVGTASMILTFDGSNSIGKCSTRNQVVACELISLNGLWALATTQADGGLEMFSLPALRPLAYAKFPQETALKQHSLTMDGDLLVHTNTDLSLFHLFGRGKSFCDAPADALFDALKQPSVPRPTISNWAWVTGTQYIRPSDLDLIISGGVRPLSKRAQERVLASQKQQELLDRQKNAALKTKQYDAKHAEREASGRQAFNNMREATAERGERVSHVSDVMDNLGKASGEWLGEIDKLTKNAKKAAFRSFIGI